MSSPPFGRRNWRPTRQFCNRIARWDRGNASARSDAKNETPFENKLQRRPVLVYPRPHGRDNSRALEGTNGDCPTAAWPARASRPSRRRSSRKCCGGSCRFLLLCYIIAYLDRVNVGVASLTMNSDLGLSPSAFGWSAGLFFFGYFLAEVPSNLALQAVGARKWIARILITWGLLSAATAFVVGPVSFGVMRFLLGLGEAGFTPGVFLYFTYWFPARVRGRATAAFLLGIPIANIVGAPISSSLLALDGLGGLHGWQWLLILEGLPATMLGFVCFFTLTDKPEQAKWLSEEERRWLVEVLVAERAADRRQALHPGSGMPSSIGGSWCAPPSISAPSSAPSASACGCRRSSRASASVSLPSALSPPSLTSAAPSR